MLRDSLPVEIVAHRGSGRGRVQPDAPPENTLPAFAWAWSPGVDADAAEVDVQQSKDGALVAIHDRRLDRTTDGRGSVSRFTLSELRRLDAGSWKSARYAGTRLPVLEEVIATVPRGKRLFIEIKTGPRIVARLAGVLAASGKAAAQFPIIGFDIHSVALAKRRLPDHECYLVTVFRGADLVRRVKAAGLDGIDVRYPVSGRFLHRLEENGLKCAVWTVNRVERARRLAALGVHSITTDVPLRVRAALKSVVA